ncbi:hypothetical protein A1O1_03237 [Capronia coronata CBS 617.96]|uniref:C3H1-type domain-containing protein n=1 Tax=Capronia coronata CBS 617.96 TaxID=1182541 RepID=W9ZK31_9EURO|nr:uncharacterized protein A1O1_03237 [Capronia coronata CBS 617.96]EXJ94839.1 hypothetical protein A1O1_03237 [Capronia coronata CBS 617.96]
MSEQQALKPQFFVTRQNGVMVPLIAMDELPVHVQLRNVPRILDPYNIAGMIGVGFYESRHQYYVVEALNNSKPLFLDSIHAPHSDRIQAASSRTNVANRWTAAAVPRTPVQSPAPPKAFGVDEQRPSGADSGSCTSSTLSVGSESKPVYSNNVSNLSAKASAVAASNKQPNIGQSKVPAGSKEYCSFWIRRGECDYAQQGCVYKHEMPLDLPTLERIGHRDIPRWYREQYGLGSLLVAGGQSGPSFGVSDPKAVDRKWRVSDDAKRMICHGLGVAARGQGPRPGNRNYGKNYNVAKDKALEAEKAKAEKEKELIALKLAEDEEKERKALAAKYKVLRPDHRSIFDHELDSDTFSNGEEPNDLMAKIRAKEQAGWEKEKARASIINSSAASSTIASKRGGSSKENRGGRYRGGTRRGKN